VVAGEADEVAIMYAGRIVEQAPTAALFKAPAHPYSEALLAAIPRLDRHEARLASIPGTVPDPRHLPSGCRFRQRCPRASERCAREDPALEPLPGGSSVACFHPSALSTRAEVRT
jgi:peptide/nickel transport system ATP-binding protein